MSDKQKGALGSQLSLHAVSDIDTRLRLANIKRIDIAASALVDPKVVRKVLNGQPATQRSVRAVVAACRRLLRGTEGELSEHWLKDALIPTESEPQEASPQPLQTLVNWIELDLWLHRTNLGADHVDERIKFQNLDSLLQATEADPVLLLLADPGAGKTSILQEYASRNKAVLYVKVESYGGGPPFPWLSSLWQATGRSDASFKHALRSGNLTLLLDGLSEGRRINGEHPATTWSRVIRSGIVTHMGNRVIVSCRQLEYDLPLKLSDRKVPTVRISGVRPEQVTHYLENVLGTKAISLIALFKGRPDMLQLCSNPMLLSYFVEAYSGGIFPENRSDLFRMLVWNIMRREHQRHNVALVHPLVSHFDQLRLTDDSETIGLPDEGVLLQGMQKLAWALQSGSERRLRMTLEDSRKILGGYSDEVLAMGAALTFLSLDLAKNEVGFQHHLLQEFFVACEIKGNRPEEMTHSRWIAEAMTTDRSEGTGWEEVAVFIAGLSSDPSRFVEDLSNRNLPLAAKTLREAAKKVASSLHLEIQERLIARMRDNTYSLDDRMAAGGELIDLQVLGYQILGPAWIPPLRTIKGNTYTIGTPTPQSLPRQYHAPSIDFGLRKVEISSFQIASFPVTNAEFGKFLADGGYQDLRWWSSSESKKWLSGSKEGMRWQLRQNRRMHKEWGEEFIRENINIRWTPREANEMFERLRMTEDEFERWVWTVYPDGRPVEEPFYWYDPELNRDSQPIVGVSWYEATAYCQWLSHVAGRDFVLLPDVNLEVAARGKEGRTFSFGDQYTNELANLHVLGIDRTTPIGMFPSTPENVYDLTGNAWTWTSTLDDSQGDLRLMTFGGSYDTSIHLAPSYYRDANHPGYRDRYVGFHIGTCSVD